MTQDFLPSTKPGGDDGELTLVVRGEIDMLTAPKLDVEIEEAVARRPDVLVVDLAEVTFLDSSGCNVLVRGKRRADTAGVGLELTALPPACLRVFEIAGLLELFTIRPAQRDGHS